MGGRIVGGTGIMRDPDITSPDCIRMVKLTPNRCGFKN